MKAGSLINGNDIWIENYEKITEKVNILKAITNNTDKYDYLKNSKGQWYWGKDWKHTVLIRQAGVMKEKILKDRNWQLSTQKLKEKANDRKMNDTSYFIDNYLKMYKNFLIPNSSIYDFKIHFNEQQETENFSSSVIFITENPLHVSNIKIKSLDNNNGIVKVYHNMYKYSYYLTGQSNSLINLEQIKDKKMHLLSLIYDNLNWEKDELIEYGHDLYIICCNNKDPHNLYKSTNGYLYHENDSQFGKLYYSSKEQTRIPSENFIWTMFKNPVTNFDMLYNKSTQTFLALGVNYQSQNNFNIGTGITEANKNLDKNKSSRTPTLYFIKKSVLQGLLSSSDNNDKTTYNEMINDCSWIITKKSDNQYSIQQAISNNILWFTSIQFQYVNTAQSTNNSSVSQPLTNNTGYIGYSPVGQEEEEKDYNFCDDNSGEKCYNMYFYIVPTEPEDISSQFTHSNEIYDKQLFERCPNPHGNNTLNKNKWFQTISENNPIPYSDQGSNNNNKYKDIYKMYGDNGDYNKGVLDLGGGGGASCSRSNYCHVSKHLLSVDRSDQSVNPISLEESLKNKQTESQNLSVRVEDVFGKPSIVKNFPVPLYKYNYQCSRNQFNIYKIFGNKTTIKFNHKRNPNINSPEDDSYPEDDSNRETAVSIYSTNSNYIEGQDFGMSPDGTFVWFVNYLEKKSNTRIHLDVRALKIIKKKSVHLYNKFITITNAETPESYKRKRQKLIRKFDQLKFENIGYSKFTKNKVYAYKNMISSFID